MILAASFIVNLVGGIAFLLVGTLLLALRPARASALGFAAFALASGGQHVLGNLGQILGDGPYGAALTAARLPFQLVAAPAIVWAAGRTRGRAVWPAYPFLALGVAGAASLLFFPGLLLGAGGRSTPLGEMLFTVPYFLAIALAVGLLAASLARERSEALRVELQLLLLATALPLGYTTSFFLAQVALVGAETSTLFLALMVTFGAGLGVVLATCAVLARSGRAGVALAGVCVAVVFAGAAQSYLTQSWSQLGGLLRIAAALLLGYSLLKFRVFDIDVKVRSTLAASLLAGVAVGGFFLASEVAEMFVADRTGSALLGLAVAGGLVVLETRVTHASQRLAKRVLPRADGSEDYLAKRRVDVYRSAYESAARDGTLTEREHRLLQALARELGLSSEDVQQVERNAPRASA